MEMIFYSMNRSRSLRLFGLSDPVDPIALKRSYRRLAVRWHPDRPLNRLPLRRHWAQKRMRQINMARDILNADLGRQSLPRKSKPRTPSVKAQYRATGKASLSIGRRPSVDPAFFRYANDADAWWKMGRLEKALAGYNAAIRIYGASAAAFNNRGLIYRTMGRYTKALADLNRAVRLSPTLVSAHINRGDVHAALGRYEKAVADYDRAIALDPSIPYTYRKRGMALYRLGNLNKAQSDLHLAHRLALADSHR